MFDETTGGDHYIVAVGKVDDFLELLFWHQGEGATGEFQGIYIFAHRLQHILQVAFAHRGVVRAANLGDTARAGFALALIHTNKWKCSFVHDVPSLSLHNGTK